MLHRFSVLVIRPLHRALISIVVAFLVFMLLPKTLGLLLSLIITWSVFATCYIIISWIGVLNMTVADIIKNAAIDDGSKTTRK